MMWNKFKEAWQKFNAENGNLKAAALSFYGFLTVLPLLLLAIAVLGLVIGSSQHAFNTVAGFMDRLAPTSSLSAIRGILRGLVRTRGGITALSILTLIWTSSQIFVVMQQAFNAMWDVDKQPGFVKREVKAIVLLIGTGILFALSVGSTAIITYLGGSSLTSGTGSILSILGSVILALIFDVALFTLIYRFVPDTTVNWRSALFAGIAGGVIWEAAKQLYRLYLQYFANYANVYGSLGGIIILVLWIYYSSMILMYGTELAYIDQFGNAKKDTETPRARKAA